MEKNINEPRKKDMLFSVSVIVAALIISFAWIYTSGLNSSSLKIEKSNNTNGVAQESPVHSHGCGV